MLSPSAVSHHPTTVREDGSSFECPANGTVFIADGRRQTYRWVTGATAADNAKASGQLGGSAQLPGEKVENLEAMGISHRPRPSSVPDAQSSPPPSVPRHGWGEREPADTRRSAPTSRAEHRRLPKRKARPSRRRYVPICGRREPPGLRRTRELSTKPTRSTRGSRPIRCLRAERPACRCINGDHARIHVGNTHRWGLGRCVTAPRRVASLRATARQRRSGIGRRSNGSIEISPRGESTPGF